MTDIKSFQKVVGKKAKELRTLTQEDEIKILCVIMKSPSDRLIYYNDTTTLKTKPISTQLDAFVLGKETLYKKGCKIVLEEKVTSIFDILHVGFREWECDVYEANTLYYALFGKVIDVERLDTLIAQCKFNDRLYS